MEVKQTLPLHVAIIMDGNGRWANQHKKSRNFGHQKGAKTLEQISLYANKKGILYMTVYAFSTENWNRPKSEVDALMNLLRRYLKGHIKDADKSNIKIRVIGDRDNLPRDILALIKTLESVTQDKDGMMLNLALNYGGRDEIIRGVNKILDDIENNKIDRSVISQELLANYLDTDGTPDPDLVIRTSGEERLSNFLIWQSAYSEFYFTDILWPDFNENEFDKAIEVYQTRNRRFGNVR